MDEEATRLVSEVHDLVSAGHAADAAVRLAGIHPADSADVLQQLDAPSRTILIPAIPVDEIARIIEYLPDDTRGHLIDEIAETSLAAVLDEVDDDIAADILRGLPGERSGTILRAMRRANTVAPLLGHADETAGGHMTRAFIALNRGWTADRAIQYLRRIRPDAESAYYLYVVDAGMRLEGVVSLRDLIIAPPDVTLGDIMQPGIVSARDDMDQEEMARLVSRYDLIALPVVDAEDRLVGVITVDDVLDVLEEEATEDILKLAGVGVKERALSPVRESVRRRLPWLAVNMAVALVTAFVISQFESTIARVATVAAIMPVIAGQGGNAGIQTSTIIVRGLGLDEISLTDVGRVLRKEIALGVVKGVLFGAALAAVVWIWDQNTALAAIAGAAMLLNMLVASVAGVMIPIALRYGFRVDPATAAGVFDTMLTDILGFFIFLGLATLFIDRLT
jgi:magnesium transporter